jgi:phospholipid/cholesterol/gamma-HCH transport system substrate-binding protein
MNIGKTFETFIGTITLIFVFCLVYYFSNQYFSFRPSKYEKYNYYHAVFNDIDGLNIGSNVKIGGISVGTLNKYSIDPKSYKISVQFSVLEKYQIPDDTSISVATTGFIGEKYLQLSMGNSAEYLKEGDEIIYTQSSLNLEKLVSLLKK